MRAGARPRRRRRRGRAGGVDRPLDRRLPGSDVDHHVAPHDHAVKSHCTLHTLDLSTPLMYVKGVGPARAAMLEAKGLKMVEDLLTYAPFRYEDRSNVKTIRDLAPGEMATVLAEVRSTQVSGFQRRNLGLFEATFTDASRRRARGQVVSRRRISTTCSRPGRRSRCSARSSSIPTRAASGDDASGVRDSLGRRRRRRVAAHRPRRADLRSRRESDDASASRRCCIGFWKASRRCDDPLPPHILRAAEAAGPLERHPRAALSRRRIPTCGC